MDAVAETIQERRNTLIETQEMIAILALVIVAVFVIVVGFDCIKDGMCDIGAVIHDIIAAPVRHYRQKKLMEQMEREWENYLEKNRAKMVRNLMKEQQRHFSTSIGEKHTVEEWERLWKNLRSINVSRIRRKEHGRIISWTGS